MVGPGADTGRLTPATDPPSAVYHAAVSVQADPGRTAPERLAAVATAIAASIVVIAIAILPFLTPAWVSFEQGRTHAAELAGVSRRFLQRLAARLGIKASDVGATEEDLAGGADE